MSLVVLPAIVASGCSLLLDFDSDARDAGPTADAFLPDQALCQAFEPDHPLAMAKNAQLPAQSVEAAICSGSATDFFTYTAPGNQSVTVSLQYQGSGELGLRVHDPEKPMQETNIKEIAGSGGTATLQFLGTELLAKPYAIEVFPAASGVEAHYTLTVNDGT